MLDETRRQFQSIPVALKPHYATRLPNEEIVLYNGLIHIQVNDQPINMAKEGTVSLSWLPEPSIRFLIPDVGVGKFVDLAGKVVDRASDITVTLPPLEMSGKGSITRMEMSTKTRAHPCYGILEIDSILKPTSESVLFHLVNFENYFEEPIKIDTDTKIRIWTGRLVLQNTDWEVVIDQTGNKDLQKLLKAQGGFAITHTGRIKSKSGADVDYEAAEKLLYCLGYFLSFLNGTWSGPLLYVGLRGEEPVWRKWRTPHLTPWCSVASWWPTSVPVDVEHINQAFDRFLTYCASAAWKDSIISAIHLYLDANASSIAVEAKVVLACVALELLSWSYLVNETKKLSPEQFNKNKASANLRSLLQSMHIPVHVPDELSELKTVGADGPDALFNIRNRTVHPPSRPSTHSITAYSTEVRWQATVLGLWYLELAILYLLNYHGNYRPRYLPRYLPNVLPVPVPWASASS
ncbi:MAG: hypothetical protein N2385_04000 [Chloroflexus sp.]|nr:hypothetical protein [Chloroflexus sp.]